VGANEGLGDPTISPKNSPLFVKAFLKVLCRKGSWVLENSSMKIQQEKQRDQKSNGESDMDIYRIHSEDEDLKTCIHHPFLILLFIFSSLALSPRMVS
jgi:hypothetical protein